MGMPIGIDLRDADGVDVEPAFAWLRRGRRDLQHLPRRQRHQPARPRRAHARRLPPGGRRGPHALPRARARHGRLLLRPARRPPRPVRPRQGLGGRRRRASGSPRRAPRASASTRAATSSRAAGPRRTAAGASASATPTEPDRLAAVARRRGPRRRDVGRVRARRAHPRPAHGRAAARACCRSRSSARTSRTADAYATAAFAMGADGPAWTATLAGYDALCITTRPPRPLDAGLRPPPRLIAPGGTRSSPSPSDARRDVFACDL